jgi:MFS family permease
MTMTDSDYDTGTKTYAPIDTDPESCVTAEVASSQNVDASEIPDGGYGWVIVLAVFFVHVFCLGNIYSFGVFFPVYIDYFKSNEAAVAWVGSIGGCLMVGIGAWTGKLADRYSNERIVFIGGLLIGAGFLLASFSTELWHLYVTQGFITGIGYSFSFIAGISVVGQWFSKRRGLAIGIAVAGSGLGQFAISLITGFFLDHYGWRIALRYLALINCAGLLICAMFIRRRLPCILSMTSESSWKEFEDSRFCCLFLGGLFNSLGTFMPFSHITVFAARHGISSHNGVLIISMIGIASAIGRISIGWLADRFGKLLMLLICMFGGGVSTLCWIVCTTFTTLMTYAIIFGFFAGGVISLMPNVVAEMFGIQRLGSILGLLYSSTAVGNLLSAPIGGFLLDAYGNYNPAIVVAGIFLLSGMIFIIVIPFLPPPPGDTKATIDSSSSSSSSSSSINSDQQDANQIITITSTKDDGDMEMIVVTTTINEDTSSSNPSTISN